MRDNNDYSSSWLNVAVRHEKSKDLADQRRSVESRRRWTSDGLVELVEERVDGLV
jgi:hypothetical protein